MNMMSLESAKQEIERWKPSLIAELKRQTLADKVVWEEVTADLAYHDKLPNAVYIIAVGEAPKGDGEMDFRSLIVGAAVEEADVQTSPNRFVPNLVSSEVNEYSEKFGKGRCGYPHHILFAPRASGIPSFKSAVKRAIKRSGALSSPKKATQQKPEKATQTSGNGYLVSPIKGTNDVFIHIGMLRMTAKKAEKLVSVLNEEDPEPDVVVE